MLSILSRINAFTVWISKKLLIFFLATNIIIIFWAVLCRYVLNLGQLWVEEVAIAFMVWSVFLGCNLAINENAHIKLDIILKKIPSNYKKWVMIVIYIGMLFFLAILLKYGLELVYILRMSRSPALRFKMYWLVSSIPIGFGLSFLQVIELLILEIKGIDSEIWISKRNID